MWAKRFPVPEFDRYVLKDLEWNPPEITSRLPSDQFVCTAMHADHAFYDHLSFQGEHLLAVACSLPNQQITVSGNSFAWPIHRAVICDSLDAQNCTVLADWTTPRPMNTRLGPDGGITIPGGTVYVLIGHRVADYWVANRIMLDNDWSGKDGNGFRILSSSENEINDFHDGVVYFEWS